MYTVLVLKIHNSYVKGMKRVKLIVGLGNVGTEYKNTRHNIGEIFLKKIAACLKVSFCSNKKFFGEIAQINLNDNKLWMLYPHTYMNKSGLAVSKIVKFYKISLNEILVIHDDLDLPCGKIRLKKGGGHAGHNGIRNINDLLGTSDYYRLRVGIDHPGNRDKVVNYVLGRPSMKEKAAIEEAFNRSFLYLINIIEKRGNDWKQDMINGTSKDI